MLRFERFNTFYIFNLHLDARWGRHNSQRYGGIFSMYRNHWSNTLSTNFSDMDNYKVNSNANPVTRVFSVKDKFTLRSTDGLKVSAHASYYFRQVPRVTNEPERYRDFSAGIKCVWTITDNDYVELAYAFDQYDKSTLQRSQNLDIRSYSNVQNSVRALYNHTMGRGDILTVGGDMMRDYLMNDKLCLPLSVCGWLSCFSTYSALRRDATLSTGCRIIVCQEIADLATCKVVSV